MKTIETLIPDIYEMIRSKEKGWFTDEIARRLSDDLSLRLRASLGETRGAPTLRLSQMGPRCPRQLWYSIRHPELSEQLPPWAEIKYAYGHIIEGLVIALAKATGHEVVGEQDEIVLDGVLGHRDAVIDGCVVDVKSSSSFGMAKFKDGSIKEDDPFGYLSQLDAYVVGSNADPLVRVKDKGYLLAIDKTLGHMVLYEHTVRERDIRDNIGRAKIVVDSSEPPACTCGTVPEGKSGNIKLDTRASYSLFKHCCFPALRTFLYANGPVYLTKVVRKPDVVEVDKHGKIVYA